MEALANEIQEIIIIPPLLHERFKIRSELFEGLFCRELFIYNFIYEKCQSRIFWINMERTETQKLFLYVYVKDSLFFFFFFSYKLVTDYTVEIISFLEKQTPHQYLAKTEKKSLTLLKIFIKKGNWFLTSTPKYKSLSKIYYSMKEKWHVVKQNYLFVTISLK